MSYERGPQGIPGVTGPPGTGTTGPTGATGIGVTGATGATGIGATGATGANGANGQSSSYFNYQAQTNGGGLPTSGHITWQNATQTASTYIRVNHINDDGVDIELFLTSIQSGNTLIIQNQDDSTNFQKWNVSGSPIIVANNYVQYPVTLTSSSGLDFTNNHRIILATIIPGPTGPIGPTGATGSNATISSGLLRAINCNLYEPTTINNIVWNNLTPTEKLAWKGGSTGTSDPVQSATGNYWNFTKLIVGTQKIGWYIPANLSALTFQDLESFWVKIRFNTTANIAVEGNLYFQIETSPPTIPNTFRTRWNYCNSATPMNLTGYFYKLYCLDTIPLTTTANLGKGQEIGQQKFKTNPCNVEPTLWSIGLNKLVLTPAGDTGPGYTTAPIQSISLQTSSNINTFNFDVVAIGYNNVQYNLNFS